MISRGASSRASHKDLYEIMQGLRRNSTRIYQDLHKISEQGGVTDLAKIFILKLLRESHKIVIKRTCCCWRGSYKILIQEPPRSLPQELSYKHLEDMASAKSSCQNLIRFGDFTRVSTRSSHKEWQKTMTKIFMPGPLGESHKIVIKGPAGLPQELS